MYTPQALQAATVQVDARCGELPRAAACGWALQVRADGLSDLTHVGEVRLDEVVDAQTLGLAEIVTLRKRLLCLAQVLQQGRAAEIRGRSPMGLPGWGRSAGKLRASKVTLHHQQHGLLMALVGRVGLGLLDGKLDKLF